MADEYEVLICQYGTRIGTRSQVFLNYEIYGQEDAPIGMDYFVWVVRNGDRTILVDTGFSEQGGENRRRTWVKPQAEIYAALGIETHAPITIVVTHAHYDHIGKLDLFPNAEIVIAQAEYDFWVSPMGHRAQFHHSVEDVEVDYLRTAHAAGRVRTFQGELDLAPGIRLAELGGHTPGLAVVRVDTSEGVVLLASDAVHYYEELEQDLPFAFVADLPAMYAGFDAINGMVARGEVQHIVSGHDPDTLNRFARVTEGPLAGIAATIGARA
ncbi:MAG: N-acyl homoserine lactonase family protein [Microbacteriaceae bacterium]|nr:N-acyl homoserine lactonase family protein [Microbacteriaceae bacterium]